ncbi:hypothetical protein DWU98_16155, partial [Dyella monticola]
SITCNLLFKIAPKHFVPGEPPILHPFVGPSTPFAMNFLLGELPYARGALAGWRILGIACRSGKRFLQIFLHVARRVLALHVKRKKTHA